MGSPFGILVILLILVGVFVGIVWTLMWGLSKVHTGLSFIVGLAGLGYLGWTAIQTLKSCAADPVLIPPEVGGGGEGRAIFACDGPSGMLSYGYALIVSPLASVTIIATLEWLRRRETKNA
ncbi:hypothetical protein [Sulfitobacter sp.]|uniref:hypothetical protein n=1 Tax=Sulfitobacter sp. TaxID=1903071 RepID=UPI003001EDE4